MSSFSMAIALMTSCSDEAKFEESENKVIDLSKYEDVVYANRQLLSEWGFTVIDAEEGRARSAENTIAAEIAWCMYS